MLKENLYKLFEEPTLHKYGTLVQILIFFNIFISIIIMFLETEVSLKEYSDTFLFVNTINIVLFTIEYILRIYAYGYKHSVNKKNTRLKYALTPMMVIDLIAILPFYLTLYGINTDFLRTLRVMRIFKLFKVAKFFQFDDLVIEIIKEKKEEFIFIFLAIVILLFTMAPLTYYAEHDAQPDVFKTMSDALWWAVITFTTIGYGDMYPVTTMGQIITSFISILGIAFYAIPGSIFTASLLERLQVRHKK